MRKKILKKILIKNNLLNCVILCKMRNNRDDFSLTVKDILAKRVGYVCSNPNCKRHTIAPNSKEDKVINIGEAAHITAAAPGGPRYDDSLSPSERKSINNGIWLCSNCATLIDRDELIYTVDLLKEWKFQAEKEQKSIFRGISNRDNSPFIEVDMLWDSKGRSPIGLNSEYMKTLEQPIPIGTDLRRYWELKWRLKIIIYNNSKTPAYDIRIIEEEGVNFNSLEKIANINNIKPLDNIELKATYVDYFYGNSKEADKELTNIPKKFHNKALIIEYFGENRNQKIITQVNFDSEKLNSIKL